MLRVNPNRKTTQPSRVVGQKIWESTPGLIVFRRTDQVKRRQEAHNLYPGYESGYGYWLPPYGTSYRRGPYALPVPGFIPGIGFAQHGSTRPCPALILILGYI